MKEKLALVILLVILWINQASCQQDGKAADKFTLLTMPFNKRPLNVYRGQLQINAGYRLAVMSRSYDSQGEVSSLKDIGLASVEHSYSALVRYGLTDFIELRTDVGYMKTATRSGSGTYFGSNTSGTMDQITVTSLEESKGLTDMTLTASIRPPWEYKWIDIRIESGFSIPTAEYKPLQPQHEVTDIQGTNTFTVNYHEVNRNGTGVPVWLFSARVKATLSKFTLAAGYALSDPLKEGSSVIWMHTFANKVFSYYSVPYGYLPDRNSMTDAAVHYQAAGWLDLWLDLGISRSSGGWTEYWGNKYENPERKLTLLEPGFEIQATPAVRIYEAVGLPLSGRNGYAPFYIFTSLRFSLFPFNRK